jgi:hypothetical protein
VNWWTALLEVFKVGVQAKSAHDQKKSAEQLLAQQRANEAAAAAATDQMAKQAFLSQANAAKMAYGSLTTPGTLQTQPSGAVSMSSLDAYLPMLVIGVVALAVLSMLFKR